MSIVAVTEVMRAAAHAGRPTTFVNYNQTVLVTVHPNGTLSVALRSDRGATWGPPISVAPEG